MLSSSSGSWRNSQSGFNKYAESALWIYDEFKIRSCSGNFQKIHERRLVAEYFFSRVTGKKARKFSTRGLHHAFLWVSKKCSKAVLENALSANYKEIIFLKSERAISYGITNMRALFTDLVTFVPLFQIKLLYRYKKFSEQYISFLFVQNFEKYL